MFSWVRFGDAGTLPVLVVVNMTPVPRTDFRVGVPAPGTWVEKLNSDAAIYGGTGTGTPQGAVSEGKAIHGCDQSIEITLPPLAAVFFQLGQG